MSKIERDFVIDVDAGVDVMTWGEWQRRKSLSDRLRRLFVMASGDIAFRRTGWQTVAFRAYRLDEAEWLSVDMPDGTTRMICNELPEWTVAKDQDSGKWRQLRDTMQAVTAIHVPQGQIRVGRTMQTFADLGWRVEILLAKREAWQQTIRGKSASKGGKGYMQLEHRAALKRGKLADANARVKQESLF